MLSKEELCRVRLAAAAAAILCAGPALAGGTVTLPESGTVNYAGPAFSITNSNSYSGVGGVPSAVYAAVSGHSAMAFRGYASGTTDIGVQGETTGTNSRGIVGINLGTGSAGDFLLQGTAPTAASSAVIAVDSGGSTSVAGAYGNAGNFSITNAKNNSSVLSATTNGPGIGGFFLSNTANGVDNTTASGSFPVAGGADTAAIRGENDGSEGQGGYFSITNTNSFSDALYATTAAPYGTAIHGYIGPAVPDSLSWFSVSMAVFGQDLSPTAGNQIAVGGISLNGVGGSFYSASGIAGKFSGGSGGEGICTYTGGPGWTCSSDRNLKDHFAAADTAGVLARLDKMPVYYYRMKGSRLPTRYLGPTAKDFKAAFDLGESDTTINTANAQGVALAAAKGLYEKLKTDEATIAADHARIAAQTDEIAALKQQVSEARTARADIASLQASVAQLRTSLAARPLQQASLVRQ